MKFKSATVKYMNRKYTMDIAELNKQKLVISPPSSRKLLLEK